MTVRLPRSRAYRSAVALAAFAACTPISADYSETAYRNATEIKAESLALLRRSDEPYAAHEGAVDALMLRADQAYEYARGLPRNEEIAESWGLIRDPGSGLLAIHFGNWERAGTLRPAFRDEAVDQLSAGFDQIICREAYKREPGDCPDLPGI